MLPTWPLLELLSWHLLIIVKSLQLIEDWVPVDFIYRYPIFKSAAVTIMVLFLTLWSPGKFERNFSYAVIFKQILVIDGWGTSCEIALILMSLDFTDDQSTFVQVMAWCRQTTSHYLNKCWPRSLKSYGITRPQWVKSFIWRSGTCRWNLLVLYL